MIRTTGGGCGAAPAVGDRLRAHGQVVRPGRNLTVRGGDASALTGGEAKHLATILATMAAVVKDE